MRVSPRRGVTFLLSVSMVIIIYLNVLSFLHDQQGTSLYSLQGALGDEDDVISGEKYVIRGGEVVEVASDRYRELVKETQQIHDDVMRQQLSGIRTVKLHSGLDTARILLDARENTKRRWMETTSQEQPSFREIQAPPRKIKGRRRSIWPSSEAPYDDRILDQLLYKPDPVKGRRLEGEGKVKPGGGEVKTRPGGGEESQESGNITDTPPPLKTILMWSGVGDMKGGRRRFIDDKCEIDTCHVTDNAALIEKVDAVIFNFDPVYYTWTRPPNQIWILWMLESPLHTATLKDMKSHINWTATYRSDSTIVTPYEKFLPYKNSHLPSVPDRNYAAGKTKAVAWFVSNCGARNRRLEYAEELGKYIKVDIYGACGPYKCSRMDQDACMDVLKRDYKFYLAFENSNCDYYITEKFFWNGLKADVVPIVMGARREDYQAAAPPGSYIHVEDFTSPADLAAYLHTLNTNDTLYNNYFRWKTMGEFINTKFWCRLCAMLHDRHIPRHHYPNIEEWWRPNGTCTLDRWDNPTDLINDWKKYVYSNL